MNQDFKMVRRKQPCCKAEVLKTEGYWKNRVKNELSAQEYYLNNKHKEELIERISKLGCLDYQAVNDVIDEINEILGEKE